ncbi:hypothetical protein KHA94_02170 [Bacillus sp. FJAT-49705]|uniref:Uncharacterized protein n=1 Tax=Cytobacillus citreus TaxID=2833586 RepID=A0ABS5NN72_9BACI|nr:hypothetical protein [Cytobacillus citreus]MBS4189021.1 hypothetical protein [Cytobacillus citreus]
MNRIEMIGMDDINFIYERVRYGTGSWTADEEELIKQKIQHKKMELKEINKELKKLK